MKQRSLKDMLPGVAARPANAVVYDDGDVEHLNPAKERFEVLGRTPSEELAAADGDDGALLEDSDVDLAPCTGKAVSRASSTASSYEPDDSPASDASDAASADSLAQNCSKAGNKRNAPAPQPSRKLKAQKRRSELANSDVPCAMDVDACCTPLLQSDGRRAAAEAGAASTGTVLLPTPRSSALADALGACTPQIGQHAGPEGAVILDASAAASRFALRYTDAKFAFMAPSNIRDAKRRRPDHPDYDSTTCHIPPEWFKQHKVSDGQRQWWEFKAAHWDSVMLFKMGRFYELFEMDAFVGVDCLGLQFMKGDQPHAGFPEPSYFAYAEQLARAGHRVVVVEQTETPEQLKAFNDSAPKGQKRKVVRREKVAVISRGTICDPAMLEGAADATFVATVTERPTDQGVLEVGLCAVDVAGAHVLLAQCADDSLHSQLQRLLHAIDVVEVVVPRVGSAAMSAATFAFLRGLLPSATFTTRQPDARQWSVEQLKRLMRSDAGLFAAKGLTDVLTPRLADEGRHAALLSAFSGMTSFLADALLAKAVLQVGRATLVTAPPVGTAQPASLDVSAPAATTASAPHEDRGAGAVKLDGAAIESLELLQSASEDARAGSLFKVLNHTVSPGGSRLLRTWLMQPLRRIEDIVARQDAVQAIMTTHASGAARAEQHLSAAGDVERGVARLAAVSVGAAGRDAPGVVLYEEPSKRRIRSVARVLKGLAQIAEAVQAFEGTEGGAPDVLAGLVTFGRRVPDFREPLAALVDCVDWEQAEEAGSITPAAGLDAAFDEARDQRDAAERALDAFLTDFKAQLGVPEQSTEVRYVTVHKDAHVLEVPEKLAAKVPRTFHAAQAKKGVKRYGCDQLSALVRDWDAAHAAADAAQGSILHNVVTKFSANKSMWLQACASAAELDALMSLAKHALTGDGPAPMCRPVVSSPTKAGQAAGQPFFAARALRHAGHIQLGHGGAFIPNDVDLGRNSAPFVLLTGPNMGGKSTLMRQVGAWVPAQELELSPVDAVFVRMGARDRILLGQSTFFVELSETSAALRYATRDSLCLLDELGRGTATLDGAAIAGAALEHLLGVTKCRGVFATHYHQLSDQHDRDGAVAVKHMACHVRERSSGGGVAEVYPLFKLTEGACPKSYGVAVARIAGIPERVAERATSVSEAFEGHAGTPQAAAQRLHRLSHALLPVWAGACQGSCTLDVLQTLVAKARDALQAQ